MEELKTEEIQIVEMNPAQLMALAVQKDFAIEKLERLMELEARWQKAQALKAFTAALAAFQAEVPVIYKRKIVDYGPGKAKFKYAPLGDIDSQIKEAMKKNLLSKKWEFTQEGDEVKCTCVISHAQGHFITNTMVGPKDDSGNKNKIQQLGSSATYLQRYTLIGALGLTTADEDTDAAGVPGNQTAKPAMTDDQFKKTKFAMEGGRVELDAVKKHYSLSEDQERELSSIKPQTQNGKAAKKA